MTGFESTIDQKQPIEFLTPLLKKENVPHALLFTGIEGIGKYDAAIRFAMACNCTGLDSGQISKGKIACSGETSVRQEQSASGIPCGCCRSCNTIQSDNHPDVITIKPDGSYIKIDQIRSLYHTLTLKPYKAKYRVVIMADAQWLNPAASNAFLKILEEPPDRTVFILIASTKTDLLQTVVSRCQHIRFNPISRDTLAAMLSEKEGIRLEDAMIVATMAKGSFSKALALSRTGWVEFRDWLIHATGLDYHDTMTTTPTGLLFLISAQLSENKEHLEDSLETIQSWLRDLIIFKYQPDKIIHKDRVEKIERASKGFTITSLLHKIKAVQSAQLAVQRPNTNVRLALDRLLFQLIKVSY